MFDNKLIETKEFWMGTCFLMVYFYVAIATFRLATKFIFSL